MIAQINCTMANPCSAGAKAGIDFLHSLPDPVQAGIYYAFGTLFICALVAMITRPFR